jgi:hypothetical protein
VISDFTANVIMVANDIWPGKIPIDYKGPYDWDYTDILTKKEWGMIWDRIKTIPDFWLRQPEMSEGVQALRDFRLINSAPIWFITSRQSTGGVSARYQTQLWLLQRQLISVNDLEKVIAVNRAEEKKELMENLVIDVSIDDLSETVVRHNTISGHQAFLLDQPWNQECKEPRVYSVKEFLERIS